ncbi:hypothetical protein [Streptomyces sp. NPDC006012]
MLPRVQPAAVLSYWACTPSKALLRPVIAVADARRVHGARRAVTGRLDTG